MNWIIWVIIYFLIGAILGIRHYRTGLYEWWQSALLALTFPLYYLGMLTIFFLAMILSVLLIEIE